MKLDRHAVLVVCDGLRTDLITPEVSPTLWELRRTAARYVEYHSLFPSATTVVSASLATGCYPARHGLVGKTMALDEGDGLRCLSTGKPDFLDRLRRATGRTLPTPTLSERLARRGGVVVMSNMSPGSAYLQDPEGHAILYHPAGSFGPGRHPLLPGEHLDIQPGARGDAAMTARFCDEVLRARRPALAVLWLSEPDHTGHRVALGSPAHRAAIAAADRCVAEVLAALQHDGSSGGGTLLIVCSDHGMETINRTVRIDEELIRAGLKTAPGSPDVIVAPNGTGALIYRAPDAPASNADLGRFLADREWVGRLLAGPDLAQVGLPGGGVPTFGLALRTDVRFNTHGVPGTAWEALDPDEPKDHRRCGQHGGLGPNEQRPFLFVLGPGFPVGGQIPGAASPVDLAPTILTHLGSSRDGMDGRPLQGKRSVSPTTRPDEA